MIGRQRIITMSKVKDAEGREEEEVDEEDEASEVKENEGGGGAATGNPDNGTKTLTNETISDDL
jgi:hypothetical protein